LFGAGISFIKESGWNIELRIRSQSGDNRISLQPEETILMPITDRIDKEARIIYTTVEGNVSADEVLEIGKRVIKDPDFGKGMNGIADLRMGEISCQVASGSVRHDGVTTSEEAILNRPIVQTLCSKSKGYPVWPLTHADKRGFVFRGFQRFFSEVFSESTQ